MYLDYGGLEPEIDDRYQRHHNHWCDDNAGDLLHALSLWALGVMPNPPAAMTARHAKLLLDLVPCVTFGGLFVGHAYVNYWLLEWAFALPIKPDTQEHTNPYQYNNRCIAPNITTVSAPRCW